MLSFLATAVALLVPSCLAATTSDYRNAAFNATYYLNDHYYDNSTSLWNSGWWPSANELTALAVFAALCPDDYLPAMEYYFQNALANAAAWNGPGNSDGVKNTFLDQFYDDEMWWLLGWIKVYDVTQNSTYLDAAKAIFEDVKVVDGPCGGHWQKNLSETDPSANYIVAISDEQYIAAAASLANRVADNSSYCTAYAKNHTDWFYASGYLDSTGNGTILNGLNVTTCKPDGQALTYNQGTILGALVEMHQLTGNQTYLDTASEIAHGTINPATSYMVNSDGILVEPVGSLTGDFIQFKGVFVRNLGYLQAVRLMMRSLRSCRRMLARFLPMIGKQTVLLAACGRVRWTLRPWDLRLRVRRWIAWSLLLLCLRD